MDDIAAFSEALPELKLVRLPVGRYSTVTIAIKDNNTGEVSYIPNGMIAGSVFSFAERLKKFMADELIIKYPEANSAALGSERLQPYLDRYLTAVENELSSAALYTLRSSLWTQYLAQCEKEDVPPAGEKTHIKKSYRDNFHANLRNGASYWLKRKTELAKKGES